MRVERIKTEKAKPFILKKHYAKRMPSISYAFGLFTSDGMIGICTYGIPASNQLCIGVCGEDNKSNVIELNRLCINEDAPKNSASYLVGKSLRLIGNKIVVSYADKGMNHNGYVYQATNFIYTGCTKERTDAYAGDGKHSRHHKGDLSLRVKRTAKHRYVYFTGPKSFKKKAKAELRYNIYKYPKNESIKYNCIDIPTKTTLIDFI
jgi:hypothetical protein